MEANDNLLDTDVAREIAKDMDDLEKWADERSKETQDLIARTDKTRAKRRETKAAVREYLADSTLDDMVAEALAKQPPLRTPLTSMTSSTTMATSMASVIDEV